ncbi:MAG TPA: trigger factor [Methylomirabilota bacterium]
MKVAIEEIEACKRRLAVEAPVDVVQQEWEKAYGRVQKRASLPGFRRGHVPRSLVKLHFADDVRREVAEHLIPDVYRRALTEARIDPVNEPDLHDLKLEEGAPLSFTAVVEVKPSITLGEYRGVEVRHAAEPVTDVEVDEALERMREQHAQFNSVERAAASGDLVIVEYTLAPEGHEPTTATGYHFLVGGGTVLPEIDAAVAGMRAGEEREVPLRFADDHRMETLRGKAGTARLKLGEVKEKLLPVLDDEFAKGLGEFDTLDALRAEVRRQLEARREAESRHELEGKLVEALLGRHEFGVPDAMVMRQVAHQVEHTRERLRRQGIDPDGVQWDYPKIVGELRPGAEKAVRRALLLEAIADKEEVAASDAEVEAEVEKFARASQRPAAAVRRMMEKSGDLDSLRHGLREHRTLDLLIEHARVIA